MKVTENKSVFRQSRLALLLAAGLVSAGAAQAFQFEQSNPDVVMRFDNTIRYNAIWRVRDRNPGIANNPAHDEDEYFCNKGNLCGDRVDLFTEFDYTYQRRLGFRVSGSAWYDAAYSDHDKSNPLLPKPNYPNHQYTDYVKRFYEGPSGELLDSFVWGNFNLGDTQLNVKFGRHAVLWGEAIFPTASQNSVAVDMAPSDGVKQSSSPGATAKETTLPVHQLTGTWQLTDNLSLAGQYTYEWRPSRYPEAGTYFGISDATFFGPPFANVGGNGLPGGGALTVSRVDPIKGDSGDWGLALKWRPDWVDGNLGFYYRDYAAKTPTWAANTFANPTPLKPSVIAVFPSDIKLWGLSYGGTLWGTAVGAEISHRHNTPLNMNPNALTSAALGFEGPRGDVWSALVNTTTLFNQTDYWTSASLVLELTYQELDKVTSNPGYYKSRAYIPLYTGVGAGGAAFNASCSGDQIVKGCSTDSAYQFAMLFSPVWAQVWPSTDLTGTLVFQQGLKGNSPVNGIYEGMSVGSIGLSATYAVRHVFSLAYTNFWGKSKYFAGAFSAAGPFQTLNGPQTAYGDRDFVNFSYSFGF